MTGQTPALVISSRTDGGRFTTDNVHDKLIGQVFSKASPCSDNISTVAYSCHDARFNSSKQLHANIISLAPVYHRTIAVLHNCTMFSVSN